MILIRQFWSVFIRYVTHNLQKRYRVRPSLRRRRMILQANFVLNNPALLLKYYDFNPAILHSLYLARNIKALHVTLTKDWWEAPQKVIGLFGNGWARLSGKRFIASL